METHYIQKLLARYGADLNTELQMENGVCALQDERGLELAVLELPPPGEMLMLHCQILPAEPAWQNPTMLQTLLTMNFEIGAMNGCWLALDRALNLRLCSCRELILLDHVAFALLLNGFIERGHQVRDFIQDLLEHLHPAP
ncbi:type III secretion system chaperone [Pantoea stewartii]|uniref:type III secretion system chaperone n=1 Tax=Pantoea stewartii TaxID=66269 RepID=UPI0021D51945|nr:type III secretion system chaperone [Pantoea stewartii]MCU7369218.1 type III secretion system chaperone [Pantoea stewartii]